ncbi:MAG: hypothetical protein Q9217_000915 [Psora testacea]
MPELRKRKAAEAAAPPLIKKANSAKSTNSEKSKTNTAPPVVGHSINLDDFGGEIETSDGEKVTLKSLVDVSKNGVVLFTYPKASTPGCTTQACLFRDHYTELTATGLSIYGLSQDSPKSNTTFKERKNLPYILLCDPKATLITAIGMKKSPSGTTRGVFVVDKSGEVKAAAPGGPAATVEVVRQLLKANKSETINIKGAAARSEDPMVKGAEPQPESGADKSAQAMAEKYTVQSHGIWDRIRRALAVDPNRSTGVPLNPQYRNPPPGANPPEVYDDPVTIPSGDLAENPYYRRDVRRSYPKLSVVNQADVVGLLSVGSRAAPKEGILQEGDAGAKQLVQVKEEGEEKGLSAYFEKNKTTSVFEPGGLPPFPPGMNRTLPEGGRKYVMTEQGEEGYPEE